jgi:hypothetical protein
MVSVRVIGGVPINAPLSPIFQGEEYTQSYYTRKYPPPYRQEVYRGLALEELAGIWGGDLEVLRF